MRRHPIRWMLAVVTGGALLAVAGCTPNAPPANEIEVLCGGSFRPPMEKLAKEFEEETGCRAVLVFGQSEDHLPKVKMHAIGDVFVSHDPYIEYTEDAKAMHRYVTVGYVCPVLVVKKGNPEGIGGIEDLTRPGLRVVLPNPEFSTCGEMVFELLEKKQIKEAVLKNVGNAQVRSHADVGKQIKLDHRDAGIMWNGMANNWLDAIEIVPAPNEYEEIRVAVMGLSYSTRQDKAEEFLEFAEARGKEIFAEYGYVK